VREKKGKRLKDARRVAVLAGEAQRGKKGEKKA